MKFKWPPLEKNLTIQCPLAAVLKCLSIDHDIEKFVSTSDEWNVGSPFFFFNQRSCRYFTSPPGQVGTSSGGLKGLRLNEWGHCRARKGDAIGVKSPRNELAASASTFFLSLSIHRR